MHARFQLVAGLVAALMISVMTRSADAFRGCRDIRDNSTLAGCWPNNVGTTRPAGEEPGVHGTKRWSFCYKFENEGLELYDVQFGTDPAARKPVAARINMPYVMTRYPQPSDTTNPSPNPTTCGAASGPAYDDTMIASRTNAPHAEMHCAHVPTTVCELGHRRCDPVTNSCFGAAMSCVSDADCIGTPGSALLEVGDCTGSCVTCRGVCAGTQVELGGVELGGENEVTAGGDLADVVLTTMNMYGGYQFYQRYRFKHDGRLVASFRFGGVFLMQWHNHIAYWRLQFDLPGSAGNDVLQRCDAASCGTGPAGWSTRGCECQKTSGLPIAEGLWRVFDRSTDVAGTPTRSVVIRGGPNDGQPTVCANTDKDYCVQRANHTALPNEGLTKAFSACTDGLDASSAAASCGDITQGAPLAFWYLGHHNGHTPCDLDEQAFCGPEAGEQAMGPVLELVGDW